MSWRKKMRRAARMNPGVQISCPAGYTLKCVSFGGPEQSCKCIKCGGAPYICEYADPIVKPAASHAAGFGYGTSTAQPPPVPMATLQRNPGILMPALAQAGPVPPQRTPYGPVIVPRCTRTGWCY